jgi:hypothetical protein
MTTRKLLQSGMLQWGIVRRNKLRGKRGAQGNHPSILLSGSMTPVLKQNQLPALCGAFELWVMGSSWSSRTSMYAGFGLRRQRTR